MSSSSTNHPITDGRDSVAQAPNLPRGFTDTFTSRYVDTGELRLHAKFLAPYRESAARGASVSVAR